MVQRIGLDLATPIRTFDVARENTRQQEQRNALSRFLPAALLEGDRDALNQLVAANPQAALQVFGIQEQQKARKAADVRSDRAFAENIRQFDVQLKDKRAARAATAQLSRDLANFKAITTAQTGPLVTLQKGNDTRTVRQNDPSINSLLTQGFNVVKKPSTVVNVGGSETEFTKELGKKSGAQLVEDRQNAVSTAQGIQTIDKMLDLLDEGIFTGPGANVLVGIENLLGERFGVPVSERSSRSQQFVINSAKQMLQILGSGALGAGTGISDEDRRIASRIAGGDITMSGSAIKRVLEASRKAQQTFLNNYRQQIETLTSATDANGNPVLDPSVSNFLQVPLANTAPPEPVTPQTTPQSQAVPQPQGQRQPSQQSIDALLADPSKAGEFDEFFGPGSAARILGGQ